MRIASEWVADGRHWPEWRPEGEGPSREFDAPGKVDPAVVARDEQTKSLLSVTEPPPVPR